MGELSGEEALLLESDIQKDSVLQEKLHQLESDFEQMAMENAISPPQKIRAALVRAVDQDANRYCYSRLKAIPLKMPLTQCGY